MDCGYFPLDDLLLPVYIANYGMFFPTVNRSEYLIAQLSKSILFHNLERGMDEHLVSEFLYPESKVFCLIQHLSLAILFCNFFYNTEQLLKLSTEVLFSFLSGDEG